jgi:hypothetical protein
MQGAVATKKRRTRLKVLHQKKDDQSRAAIENPDAATAQAVSAPPTDPTTAQKIEAAATSPRKNAAPTVTAVDVKSAAVIGKAVVVSANARASLALHVNLVKVVDVSVAPAMRLALLVVKRGIGGVEAAAVEVLVLLVLLAVLLAVLTMDVRGGEMLRIRDSMVRRRGGVSIVLFFLLQDEGIDRLD